MITLESLTDVTPEDLAALTALEHELHDDGRTPTAEEVGAVAKNPDAVLMVAREGERIVGMATLYVIQKLGKRSAYLEDVVVLEEYRGQGIGKRIVAALIDEARRRGVQAISLTSRPERAAAHHLYESLGFAKRETDVFKLTL